MFSAIHTTTIPRESVMDVHVLNASKNTSVTLELTPSVLYCSMISLLFLSTTYSIMCCWNSLSSLCPIYVSLASLKICLTHVLIPKEITICFTKRMRAYFGNYCVQQAKLSSLVKTCYFSSYKTTTKKA